MSDDTEKMSNYNKLCFEDGLYRGTSKTSTLIVTGAGEVTLSSISLAGDPTGVLQSYAGDIDTNVRWDDLRIPGLSVRTGASAPDLVAFGASESLAVLSFDGVNTTEQVFFTVQLPHSYKEGTALSPHVHWTPTSTAAGNVIWNLEYSWQNINGTFPTATTTISTTAQAAGGTPWVQKIAEFSDIVGTGKLISSMLVCRLYRNPSAAGDTYGDDAAFLEIDFHFQQDSTGSRSEYTK